MTGESIYCAYFVFFGYPEIANPRYGTHGMTETVSGFPRGPVAQELLHPSPEDPVVYYGPKARCSNRKLALLVDDDW